MELKELHEEVFKFLLEKRKADPSLRYTLRGLRGKNTNAKLVDNLWFLEGSNAQTLYLSFWHAYPDGNTNSYPIIRFEVSADGKCVLRIRKPNREHRLWRSISLVLNLETKKLDEEWEKQYEGNDFKKHLEHFLSAERPYINSVFKLGGIEADYPSIGEVEFTARFTKIQELRSKQEDKKLKKLIEDKLLVEALQLTNINAFATLNISFNKQVTCFVGGNGSGKTTILRAIALGLVGLDAFKIKPNLLAIQEAKSNTIYEKKGEIDVFYRYEGKENERFGVYYTSIDEGLELREGKNLYSQGGVLAEEEALKALIIGFAQQSYAEPKISKRRRPNITDIEALILNEPNNRFQEFVNWFQEELKKDLPEYHKFRDTISKILNVINDCIRKEEKNIDNDIDFVGITEMNFVTHNNPKGIPIDKLSQGYRNVLGWVGFLAKRMYEYKLTLVQDGILSDNIDFLELPAVCLIDEIDTYLHLDWQYSILKGLVDSFPNVQFIITSHSPFVLTSVPSDKLTIYELNTEGGKVEAQLIHNNLYGADANRSTKELSSERLPDIKAILTQIDEDTEKGSADDLLRAETALNDLKIDKTDIAFVMAKRKIQVKRLSSKN